MAIGKSLAGQFDDEALRRPKVTICIIGATKPKQLEENAEASGVTLTSEEAERINAVLE